MRFFCGTQLFLRLIFSEASESSNDANTFTQQKRAPQNGKFKRKERCCDLGRKMAKIGESCTYATTMAQIHPNAAHYHMMKTSVWTKHPHPIKIRRLQKCKRYKAYFQKCCFYESSQIDEDIRRMSKKVNLLRKRFSKKKPNLRSKTKMRFKVLKMDVSPRGPSPASINIPWTGNATTTCGTSTGENALVNSTSIMESWHF